MWLDESVSLGEGRQMTLDLRELILSSSSKEARNALGHANAEDVYSIMNDTDEHARKLYGPNYGRLQRIKREYDPDMVWNRWFAVRPA